LKQNKARPFKQCVSAMLRTVSYICFPYFSLTVLKTTTYNLDKIIFEVIESKMFHLDFICLQLEPPLTYLINCSRSVKD